MDSCLYDPYWDKSAGRWMWKVGASASAPPAYKNGAFLLFKEDATGWLCFSLAATAILDALGQGLNLVVGIALFRHLFADLAIGIDHRGVVLAAELLANLGQR